MEFMLMLRVSLAQLTGRLTTFKKQQEESWQVNSVATLQERRDSFNCLVRPDLWTSPVLLTRLVPFPLTAESRAAVRAAGCKFDNVCSVNL